MRTPSDWDDEDDAEKARLTRRATRFYAADLKYRLPDKFTQPIEEAAEARGLTRALLSVLAVREIPITIGRRDIIDESLDRDLLLTWVTRASTAGTAEEVFG
ncbi:hypothetical protein HII36_20360 [Nonomuraea sp. NN258]|uniref:hypothetical protein n=1 Tax=Nonomuraea antri TaxID=2730852 RepID=UPI001569DAB6|nr:hypothetical protein [Nonomuraea antri]NRQ34185.1 hypothetical protein [Nonomuraea antri]